ncbi:MAG: DUF4340 domain-containing protein [Bacteroidia bacterium]|nr:DUF4340 domain-containing protein [Bacteroidia bacterium]NNJ56651.1 DUF4340 domain-containing protein [Bacteroidia bacterium]
MRQIILILLTLSLAVGVYFYFNTNNYQKTEVSINDFSVKDISSITKIKMGNRDGENVVLTKKGDMWMVNDEYPAFQPNMDILLNTTLTKIKIKGPVPKSAKDNVIRTLISKSIHVQLYEDDDIVKSYYVGGGNPTQTGTYLHIEGASTPFIGYIPGFTGLLYPKYSCDPKEWFNKTIFDFTADEINQISVKNNEDPSESFVLTRNKDKYEISPSLPGFSQVAAKSYFSLFKFKNFEGYADYINQDIKDSIKKQIPYLEIELSAQGEKQKLNVFRKGQYLDGNTLVDKSGDEIVTDVHRYFASFGDFKYLVTIQDYTFGKILIPRSYFRE